MISGVPYPVPTWSQGRYPLSDVSVRADGEELGERCIARFLQLLDEHGITKETLAECWKVQPDTARKKMREPHRLNRKQVSSLCKLLDMNLEGLRDHIAIENRQSVISVINRCANNISDTSLDVLFHVAEHLYLLEVKAGWAPDPRE